MTLYMVERRTAYGKVTYAVLNTANDVVARCDSQTMAHLIASLLETSGGQS